MKKEETIVYHRPELAKKLREAAELAIALYERDPREVLYVQFALSYEEKFKDDKKASVLREAAKWFADKNSWYRDISPLSEQWDETFPYKNTVSDPELDILNHELRTELHPERLTEATAARMLCELYRELILAKKEELDTFGFTKAEKYAVDSFFSMLLAPTRNPNIQIHEGCANCYYDEHPYDSTFSYRSATNDTIQYIKENLDTRLYFFETPDEELDKEP